MAQVSVQSSLDIVLAAIENAQVQNYYGLPARVITWYPVTQSIDCLPLIQQLAEDANGDLQSYDLPVLTDVPVCFPSGGGWSISFPLATGDIVHLCFAQQSIDELLGSSGTQTVSPRSQRRNALSDAVAIPGFRVRSNPAGNIDPNAQNLVIGREDGSTQIVLDGSGNITITASGALTVNAGGTVNVNAPSINLGNEGHPAAFGDTMAAYLVNHQHISAAPGSPTSFNITPEPGALVSSVVNL